MVLSDTELDRGDWGLSGGTSEEAQLVCCWKIARCTRLERPVCETASFEAMKEVVGWLMGRLRRVPCD